MTNQPVNLLWFKRDLRLCDHPALVAACESGLPVLMVYCIEPSWEEDGHTDVRHCRFLVESLADLSRQLEDQGHRLWVFHSDAITLFRTLVQHLDVRAVYSHEEVGLTWTWRRDRAVAALLRDHDVPWHEFSQLAVQRGQSGRRGWKRFADEFLGSEPAESPVARVEPADISELKPLMALRCHALPAPWLRRNTRFQKGGEQAAHMRLQAFLTRDGRHYRGNIGKPDASRRTGSRLSPYLAFGNLSIRQVAQAVQHSDLPPGHRQAVYSRLRWHCHFIQKFESATRIEFEPLNPAYIALLNEYTSPEITGSSDAFKSWAAGQTGYPLVDACMRALIQTGFLNFRMRAMLVSVACHHLELHWQPVALHLARQFLDFEPGIHYPQIHMQAGHTGYNTVRVYNPLQQSLKQDPEGRFILEFVPELAPLADAGRLLHQPWEVTPLEAGMLGFHPGRDYPDRCFDHDETGRKARKRLWDWRRQSTVQEQVPKLLRNQVVRTGD